MHSSRHHIPARRSKVLIALAALLAALLLSGCAAAKQELASTQAELTQVRDQLAAAQTEISARQTEAPQLRQQIATAEAQVKVQQAENESLDQDLADAQAQVQAKETALADAQKQLAATQAELDELMFAAERLLTQAEATLQKEDLKEAQRISGLLAEKHPGTKEAARAAEIVIQIEKSLAEKAAKEKERVVAAAAKMKSETDSMRGVTFYKDKSTPETVINNVFYAYIGKKDSRVWLRLYVQYHGDDWLFVRDMVIKSDDRTWNITPEYNEWERDNSAYSVWEWYDGSVGRNEVEMLKAIATANQAIVRFNGETYYSDYVITTAEKKALQNVLDAFVALGGDLENP